MQRRVSLLIALLLSFPVWSQTPREVLDSCQGEGCGCYAAQRETPDSKLPIATLRPFTLHQGLDTASPVLGRFPAGTKALPLGEKTVVMDRGEYLVRKVLRRDLNLRPKDTLHTLLSEGEGFMTARRQRDGGSMEWVNFAYDEVELKTVRKTRTQAWVEMQVGKLRGFAPYAPYAPFEGCLE